MKQEKAILRTLGWVTCRQNGDQDNMYQDMCRKRVKSVKSCIWSNIILYTSIYFDICGRHSTLCIKYECMILSHDVSKILTACRMLQISIAQRQMKAKIHSFPTMYILGGGRCGRNGSNQGFRPKIRPKTRFFGGHKYWLFHFRVTWDAQFLSWRQFRCVPRKVWVKTFKMSYGHVQ